MHSVRFHQALVLLCGLSLLAAACGGDSADERTTATGPAGVDGSINVAAAASLTDAFGDMKAAFEKQNPDASVRFNFGSSGTLKDQILAGSPTDVFASANTMNMDLVVQAGANRGDPKIFATNDLEIAVPKGNPGKVTGLAAFGDKALLIGLCDEKAPCGRFGRQVLANAGVTPQPDTNEADVRALLTKVSSGDLDAGLVYRSDVTSRGGGVEGIEIPDDVNVTARYPIATLEASKEAPTAAAFVAFVLSPAGQKIMEANGFGPA